MAVWGTSPGGHRPFSAPSASFVVYRPLSARRAQEPTPTPTPNQPGAVVLVRAGDVPSQPHSSSPCLFFRADSNTFGRFV